MKKPQRSNIWDGTYQPTQQELEELVTLPAEAQDLTAYEFLGRVLDFTPPADAT